MCLVHSNAERLSFTWSQGTDAFPPYHLVGEHFIIVQQLIEETRKSLGVLVNTYLDYLQQPQNMEARTELSASSLRLANAGYELRKRLFKPNEGERDAKEVAMWLANLHKHCSLESVEIVTEGWLQLPWNLLYDCIPDEKAFVAGNDLSAWEPFWGYRYNLAVSQRVDVLRTTPLRRMPWSENLKVLLVVDPGVFNDLPETQQLRLKNFADRHSLSFIGNKSDLATAMAGGRADLMYWLGHATPEALYLGDGDDSRITPTDLTKLLEGDDDRVGGLIFLNACRTAEATQSAGSYLKAVFGLKMSGLIATEHQTIDTFACPFGVDFLEAVLDRGEPVGLALQRLRQRVPEDLRVYPHIILLGLLYGTYCPPELCITRPALSRSIAVQAATPAVEGGILLGGNLLAAQRLVKYPPLPDKPYRSLQYFERKDRALFAGRTEDTLRAAQILAHAETRLLFLHGESGCGKSSFLRAGLLPYLEDECVGYRVMREFGTAGTPLFVRATADLTGQLAQTIADFCREEMVGDTPAGAILKINLQQVLAGQLNMNFDRLDAKQIPVILRERLVTMPNLLGKILQELGNAFPFTVVLVIDQAEEIFTLNWRPEDASRRNLAFEILRTTLLFPGNYKLILTLRTEYYGRFLDRLRRGVRDAEGVREYLISDFCKEQLTEAILRPTLDHNVPYCLEAPFSKYGFCYAAGTAEDIAEKLVSYTRNRQDSVLPLAQIICTQLYQLVCDRGNKSIVPEDLNLIGGIRGGMRKHVEGLLGRLFVSKTDIDAVKRLLVTLFRKQPDGTLTTEILPMNDAVQQWHGELPFEQMLSKATDSQLLRVGVMRGERGEQRYLSLGHDALARVAEEWKLRIESRKRAMKWIVGLVGVAIVALVMTLLSLVAFFEASRATKNEKKAIENAEIARNELWDSYLSQARSQRLSQSIGQRFGSLKVLSEAAKLRRDDILLRNEAIACMPLPDVRCSKKPFDAPKVSYFQVRQDKQQEKAIALDAGLIASIANDGKTVVVTDTIGTTLRTLDHPFLVQILHWRRDGKYLAAGSKDANIYIWKMPEGRLQSVLYGHQSEIYYLEFTTDGSFLVSNSPDSNSRLWDPIDGRMLLSSWERPFVGPFSPDSRQLANGGKVLDFEGGEECRVLHHGTVGHGGDASAYVHGVWQCDFSPDNRVLATARKDSVVLWDVETGKELASVKTTAAGVGFESDGTLWVSELGGVSRWPLNTQVGGDGSELRSYGPPVRLALPNAFTHSENCNSTVSRDGRYFIASDMLNHCTWVIDMKENKVRHKLPQTRCMHSSVSPNGRYIVTSSWDYPSEGRRGQPMRVYDMESGQETRMLTHDSTTSGWWSYARSTFSPDGLFLATADRSTITFWETRTWTATRSVSRKNSTIPGHVEYSIDGGMLACSSSNFHLNLMDSVSGREIASLTNPYASVISGLRFSPLATHLAVTTETCRVFLWDLRRVRERLREMDLDWNLSPLPRVPSEIRSIRININKEE